MSQAAGVLDLTFKAGEDLTDLKYHYVKLDGSGGLIPCVADELSIGILQNEPDIVGQAARVRLLGTSKLVMGGACSENDPIKSDANGHGVVADTNLDYIGAIALEAAGGADEIIEVLVTKMHLKVGA